MIEESGFDTQWRRRRVCWSQHTGFPCGPLNPMYWG